MSASAPLLFSEGFDHYSMADLIAKKGWTLTTSGPSHSVVAGRYGGQAIRYSATTSGKNENPFRKSDPVTGGSHFSIASGSPFVVHVAWRWASGSFISFRPISLLTAAGGLVANVFCSDSQFSINNAANTTVATGGAYAIANWYSLQLVGTVGSSTTLSLYVNGVLTCSANGVNTGTTTATNVGVEAANFSNFTSPVFDTDDIAVFATSSPVGEIRIDTLYPSVTGSYTAWTANTGTGPAAVDDPATIDSDTTYISSNTAGDRSTFTVPALSTTSGTVYGVTVIRTERKDDTPTRQTAPVIVASSTTYDGTTGPGLTTSYLPYLKVYSQRPDSVDWAIADFGAGAVEFGTKVAT